MSLRARLALLLGVTLTITAVPVAAVAIESSAPVSASPADMRSMSISSEIAPFPDGATRLAGASRYETALQVAKRYEAGVPAVFVATGTNFPDALSAAAAAANIGGPLLLTTPTALPSGVLQEIKRLAPQTIYVIGGTGAISSSVLKTLESVAPTKRLAGTDRYSTGRRIIDSTFASSQTVFIATGASFPDALAATGAAGARNAPVLLVRGTDKRLDSATLESIARLGATEIVIAGGSGVVSSGIAAQLKEYGYSVTRFGGSTRYETAALVNSSFFPAGSSQTMLLATGTNFPDALAGAAMAGRMGAPLFITTAKCTPEPVRDSIASLAASRVVVMGGSAVVSSDAAANLGCLTVGTPTVSGNARVGSVLSASPGAWTTGTTLTYAWYADGRRVSGAAGSTFVVSESLVGKRINVLVTGSKSGWLTASQRSALTSAVVYPLRTTPIDTWKCPSWAPIKGNADSGIYHVPSGAYYAATNPEECFRTESAAVAAGYRKSKV